jgi:hypothetical protein
MEAPTGPEGVRPCDCIGAGIAKHESTTTIIHNWPARGMRDYTEGQRRAPAASDHMIAL